MRETAEPVEIATVIAALVWVALVTALLVGWVRTLPKAMRMPNPQAMTGLVWVRIIAHVGALFVALIVLGAGLLQVTLPPPATPGPWRSTFMNGWLIVATSQILTLGIIEYLTRRAIRSLESEPQA